jgi:hypothetical protein
MSDMIRGHAASRQTPGSAILLPPRRTPVYRAVDVLVCGGGPAGSAAAVAAARSGANTLLVERNVVLGGNGPLSFQIEFRASARGIPAEIARRLRDGGDLEWDERAMQPTLVHDPEALKYVLLDLVREAGVGLLLSTWACAPIMRGREISGAFVENKSGRFAIPALVVVDATGDGELAMRAGAAASGRDDPFPLAMNARIGGIDFDRALAGRDAWPALVAEAKRRGLLSPAQPDTIALYGITARALERRIAFLRGPVIADCSPSSAEDLTAAEITSRRLLREFLSFLHTVPGFEASFLVDAAGTVAVSRSRHAADGRTPALADVEEGRTGGGDAMHAEAGSGLPLARLLPAGVENLLVAGRAASIIAETGRRLGDRADPVALGEAAGLVAAAAAKGGIVPRALGESILRGLCAEAPDGMDRRGHAEA